MAHHAGSVTVRASGQTRDVAIARCVRLVQEATGEDAHSSYSGRAKHWILDDSCTEVIVVQQLTGAEPVLAGVDVEATFVWKDAA